MCTNLFTIVINILPIIIVITKVLARWMYPPVPHPSKYKYSLGHVYTGHHVKIDKGSALEECILVGDNCTLGKVCQGQVSNSSIGEGSSIGEATLMVKIVMSDEKEEGGGNLVLEINGSKHAWITTLAEVNQCVLYSVLTANSQHMS